MRELIFPIAVVAVLASMLLPLPPYLMDFLLVGNLILALILLVSSFYITDSLKLSSLPTMLLLATLYRLALNVSATRLILGSGEAGKAIEAFGGVVIGGNLVVGVVVFLIITLIQFIVIAKGSERVAEVSARFTLDALPGKQMSIDADVRAGLIDFETARQKRQDLQTESRFYGALDGAMKFVKGDAIAGLVITVINIVGGFAIGVLVLGMDLQGALSKYTILTVGDGLLSQIPALLNSLAAGMVVTRVARGDGKSLAGELLTQIGQEKQARFIIAGVACLLAIVPGMPVIPFVCVALFLLLSGLVSVSRAQATKEVEVVKFDPRTPALLQLAVTENILRSIQASGELAPVMNSFRQEVYDQWGLILAFPELTVLKGSAIDYEAYRINMRGVHVKTVRVEKDQKGEFNISKVLADIFLLVKDLLAKRTTEFIDDILTRRVLDCFDKESPELVSAVVPGMISLTQLTEILKGLTREGIGIRNFDMILQAIAEGGRRVSGDRALLEEVRSYLKRVISAKYTNQDGVITGIALDPVIDLTFAQSEKEGTALETDYINCITNFLGANSESGDVLLVSKGARRILADCLRVRGLNIPVLAYDEITEDKRFQCRARIEVNNAREEVLLERLAA